MKDRPREDRLFMQRCLALAQRGEAFVSPNPMVGCVIVKGERIVAEGFHHRFGGLHAEAVALRYAGRNAKGATLYVNLEPCAHYGKTPPCTDAIIEAGITRVVAAMKDPNPLVSGKGFKKLRDAGIHVVSGILRSEAEHLNHRFVHFMRTGRPFVSLKVAQTLDGLIADVAGASKWITQQEARRFVHHLRSTHDAVLVGANTVRTDDPELTVRSFKGRNPVRVVLDGKLSLSPSHKVFQADSARTILLTSTVAARRKKKIALAMNQKGIEVVPIGRSSTLSLANVLDELGRRGISSVLVEGGSRTASDFLEEGLVNRVYVFVAPKILGKGLSAISLRAPRHLQSPIAITDVRMERFGDDLMIEGTPDDHSKAK